MCQTHKAPTCYSPPKRAFWRLSKWARLVSASGGVFSKRAKTPDGISREGDSLHYFRPCWLARYRQASTVGLVRYTILSRDNFFLERIPHIGIRLIHRPPAGQKSAALRAKANSVRSNPDRCASKGGHLQPCGPGGGRSVAEADGRPAGLESHAGHLVRIGTSSPR
jgi:hypothetical protein